MKLTKQLAAEISGVYEAFWVGLFNVDMEIYTQVLDDSYRLIGTTEKEVFFNKQEAIHFLKATGEQLAGNIERRKSKTKIEGIESLVLITDQFDLYVLIDDRWTFYGKTRVSTLMQQKQQHWKIIQQHFSLPDAKAEEGQTIGLEKITKENLELREAVKRRTVELESKNRELEIETSLEKVRSVAMGMKEPADMLKICKTISQQLTKLGVKEIRNVQTAVFYESRQVYMNYEFYTKHDKTVVTETSYTNHKLHRAFAMKMLKGKGQFYKTHIKDKKVKEWIAYQKTTNVFIDKYLNKASSLNYYWHSLGPVALGISTYDPLTKENSDLFLRFLKVFELAYRRYLDIEKALAQAREAQIETSLEKMRAIAMGMNKPEDLLNVCETLFKEFKSFGVDSLRNAMINIHNDANKSFVNYDYSDEIGRSTNHLVYNIHPLVEKQIKKIRSANDAFSETFFTGKDLVTWKNFRKKIGEKDDPRLDKNKGLYYYFYSIGIGAIGISTFGHISEEKKGLLKRFRNVFALSYQRYTDIAKAEAQAREAKIETALERVRSRSMAMQKSEELQQVIQVVYEQFVVLNIPTEHTGFVIDYKERDDRLIWVASKYGLPSQFTIPYFDSIYYNSFNKAKEKGLDFFATNLSFEEKNTFYRQLFTHIPEIPEEDKKFYFSCPGLAISTVLLDNIGLYIENFEGIPYSDEDNATLMRFGKVFQQTYTRFLDLQKAEASAKEAQVEAALERVRSRSMAMHNSNELLEASEILFLEMQKLGIESLTAGYVLIDEAEKNGFNYTPDPFTKKILPQPIIIPHNETAEMQQIVECWKKGNAYYTVEMNEEETIKHQTFIAERSTNFTLTAKQLIAISPAKLFLHNFYFKEGYLLIVGGSRLSADQTDIMLRFAKVFQQTYTRFLDLQKAEAQAKEAKIEAALERVRSRSLAMHHSSELSTVVDTLLQEFTRLEFTLTFCIINLINGDDLSNTVWAANPETGKDAESYYMKFEDYDFHRAMWKAWKAQDKRFVYTLAGEEKKIYDEYLYSETEFKRFPKHVQEANKALPRYVAGFTFFKYSGLQTVSVNEITEAELEILERFGKVFEQAYVRFLDLQKAEAQAKEAQIEAALERVRSRTMAMQKSDELPETSYILFQQMKELGEPAEQLTIGVVDEENNVMEVSATVHGGMLQKIYLHSLDEPFMMSKVYNAWKNQQKTLVVELKGNELNAYNKYRNELTKSEMFPTNLGDEHRRIVYVAFFSKGMLALAANDPRPAQSLELLERFASVFDLTYTRFLDLQKAEAQTREAQIEASLERVRSRTMAMQKSDELAETVSVLFKQLLHLGVQSTQLRTCGIVTFADDKPQGQTWITNINGDIITDPFIIPFDESPVYKSIYAAWKKGEQFKEIHLKGDAFFEHMNYLKKQSSVPNINMKEMHEKYNQIFFHVIFFSKGYLFVISYEALPSFHDIFKRFGALFQQTYTRFLDFKKAEAQAREAQIETALEKVRSRTMAMQSSNELQETAAVLFNEFKKLGADNIYQVTIGIYNEEEGLIDFRVTSWAGSGEQESRSFNLSMNEPTVLQPSVAAWKTNKKSLVIDLTGETLEGWINYRNKMSGVTISSKDTEGRRVISIAYFSKGHISISSPVLVPQETIKTLERFAAVFDGTYTRFLDLEKAEAQAREAKIEAALEKVRSRTLAMQKSDELSETAAEVFHQLISLGIDPNRLYIGIVNADTKDMDMWATDEDGTGVGKKFTFNAGDNESVKKLYDGWAAKIKSVSVDMQGKELETYFNYLQSLQLPISQGLKQKRRVQSVAYFDKGFIGMASPDEQSAQNIQLLERFAAVFNLTFTRFNDLKIAEAHALQAEQDLIAIKEAKQKAEAALTELQATQKQLIQSEKMASLGELTAGIAHEIQNPLNFVNNFSEVSKELLDEMRIAIEKGDTEDAKEIMNDVIQNLEKINHHGKRADGIVKGMLQHSRSSSAVKEPTDINALTDEYIRLCYHGLRAKDKSFNATIKTDFDASLKKINIIPQDIGRVILNLLTNAFYVVNEKKKVPQPPEGGVYEPTVSISTKKNNDKAEIRVTDNGNGIPQKVLDKIFQPFFTTKPTGQGTGLGLSLSYDIITKGHSGELKVETKEGEGTTFIISLPNRS